MDDSIQCDLLNAHADALLAGEDNYYSRYEAIFPHELAEMQDLFQIAEDLHAFFNQSVTISCTYRANLKADLIAQAHQQQLAPADNRWRWVALGASAVTVASVIAATTWRGSFSTYTRQ